MYSSTSGLVAALKFLELVTHSSKLSAEQIRRKEANYNNAIQMLNCWGFIEHNMPTRLRGSIEEPSLTYLMRSSGVLHLYTSPSNPPQRKNSNSNYIFYGNWIFLDYYSHVAVNYDDLRRNYRHDWGVTVSIHKIPAGVVSSVVWKCVEFWHWQWLYIPPTENVP